MKPPTSPMRARDGSAEDWWGLAVACMVSVAVVALGIGAWAVL